MSSEANASPGSVLVTGGSRGIGLELARRFAADGHPLVLVAREEEALEEARRQLESEGSPSVRCLSVDLAEPEHRAGCTGRWPGARHR